MNDEELESAFEAVLNTDRRLLTTRQQLWMAFNAGADFAIEQIRKASPETTDVLP